MITEADVLLLHEFSSLDYGGSAEVRDRNLLLSAIGRPYQTFDGRELYHTPIEKAAALCESLIINHPFVDGNKRTGLLAMLALLLEHCIELEVGNEDLYHFIILISTGQNKYNDIVAWLNFKIN